MQTAVEGEAVEGIQALEKVNVQLRSQSVSFLGNADRDTPGS